MTPEEIEARVEELTDRVSKLEDEAQAFVDRADLDEAIEDYCEEHDIAKLDDLADYIREAFDNARRSI